MLTARVRPRGPYSLRLSARHGSDATRIVRDGVLTATLDTGERLEQARAWQQDDGTVCIQALSDEAVEQMRFVLGVDDDHSEFLAALRARPAGRSRDAAAARAAAAPDGHRGARTPEGGRRAADHGEPRAADRAHRGPRGDPRARRRSTRRRPPADLARFAPAELRLLGLGARRGAALVRLCRGSDLEALKGSRPTSRRDGSSASAGSGPGRRASSASRGSAATSAGLRATSGSSSWPPRSGGGTSRPRRPTPCSSPYGEWAGLASVYLLAGYTAGLVGLQHENRDPRRGQDRRVAPRRAA